MEIDLIEICPICIENPAEYYTECGHCYCIGCLSRIKKCAMCRKSLLRSQLCLEIKSTKKNKYNNTTLNLDYTTLNLDYIYLDANERRQLAESGLWGEGPPQVHNSALNYNVLRIMQGMSGLAYST